MVQQIRNPMIIMSQLGLIASACLLSNIANHPFLVNFIDISPISLILVPIILSFPSYFLWCPWYTGTMVTPRKGNVVTKLQDHQSNHQTIDQAISRNFTEE